MNVPKLRFKEFNDQYETYTINELGNVITGTTPSTSDKENYGDEFLWASPIDMGIHKYIDNTKNKLSEKGFRKARAIPKDSVLITCIGSTIGKMAMASKVMATNQQINTLICNNNFNNNYMYYCIGYSFPKFLSKISFQAVPIISKSEFEKLSLVCSTNKQEQIKVANFLSLLDKKIELQTKKIEDLKLFKKSLLNKLVKDIVPEKKCKLSDLGYSYSGISGKTKEDFNCGNAKYIPFINVLKNNIDIANLPNINIGFNEKQNKVKYNDLFFTISSETKEEVGMCAILKNNIDNVYLNSFCFGFRLKDKILINNEFLCYLLLSQKYRKIISNLGQGFTRVNISKNQLLDIDVEIPSINTQNRISNTISSLENHINLEFEKLSKLNELKKGLMQNMFV